jgi:hypothetical protein
MKKIVLSLTILLFSTVAIMSEEKQQCTKLKLGKEYFECLKQKVSGITSSGESDVNSDKSVVGKSWYQKIKEGKPLLSK